MPLKLGSTRFALEVHSPYAYMGTEKAPSKFPTCRTFLWTESEPPICHEQHQGYEYCRYQKCQWMSTPLFAS